MFHGAERVAVLAALLCFGATGLTLALTGAGVPFLAAAAGSAVLAGVVVWAATRGQKAAEPGGGEAEAARAELESQLEAHRAATKVLRHDIRGVLSPALMMTDRLLGHQDPSVQRAGKTVVRSIERATAVLASHREAVEPGTEDAGH